MYIKLDHVGVCGSRAAMYMDRGGSREGKKSLRKNKVIIHVAKTRPELFHLDKTPEHVNSAAAPALSAGDVGGVHRLIDVFCNLGSRKLADDHDRVVTRSLREGVEAIIVHSPDADKQIALSEQTSAGHIYAIVGVHPDNTKKMTDARALAQRVASLRGAAVRAETVALFGGIDMTRDVAAVFPQEKLLSCVLDLAADVKLPAVLACTGDGAMVDKVVATLRAHPVKRAAFIHFGASATELARLLEELSPPSASASSSSEAPSEDETPAIDAYFIVTGSLCDTSELGREESARVLATPLDRLLLASDSPHFTPQNIEDPWIRERRNEPANLPYVLARLAAVLEKSEADVATILHANTLRFFGIPERSAAPVQDKDAGKEVAKDAGKEAEKPAAAAAAPQEPPKPRVPVAIPLNRLPVERPVRKAPQASGEATVQYACKKCRHVLFKAGDVVPHHRLVGGAATSGSDCQTIFAEWAAAADAQAGGEDDDNEDDDDIDGEEALGEASKIACPKCGARIGRSSRVGAIACSCGARKEAPAFAFARKKLGTETDI